ncbi:MAG TPA: prenyltransferase [Anaerolineaceae bacterium]|nr:prenyltransferase [Anaerolineaceae bacterium]
MKVNFSMWKKALSTLVKMDSKEEWDELDVVSKWLIATRSAVTIVTLYSCAIGGLLAIRHGYFNDNWGMSILAWVIVTLGLFIAHGTNNFLNDYTDFARGVDTESYFRTQYSVHPLIQKFWSKEQQFRWFAISGTLAMLAGLFALFYTHFSLDIIILFAVGALVLLFYTWPLKHIALGELSIFLIWGPIIVAAVFLVLARGSTEHVWPVALAAVPWGLSVVSINLGKHIDKAPEDKKKMVGTLPVVIGEKAARITNIILLALIYLFILYLVFISRYFSPILLIVFFAGQRMLYAIGVHTKPRPAEPPQDWPYWPTWFAGFTFYHNRLFSNLLLIAILIDTLLRLFLPGFWPAH